ncbi:MAG: hypothetical protein KTR19_13040 [Hyphomicrobiales bacterium]|nr:hypothetical protein [Hyphomicrobiales bacterium]
MDLRRSRQLGAYAVAATLATYLAVPSGFAQGNPVACIAQIQSEFGSNPALNADCSSDMDCSFLAAPGNDGAQAVIASIVQKAESCFTAAGQTAQGEQSQGGSSMRQFDGNDETQCALLISKPGTDSPEGVRVLCQEK